MNPAPPGASDDGAHILLVNPWIHDFAAYDVWAQPLGLLTLGAILRQHGYRVTYIDCLDRFHPNAPQSNPFRRHGRGPYHKSPLPNPAGLEDIPRTYSRYGIAPDWLRQDLRTAPKPDLILVTSLMTYWYPGVIETIAELKMAFPKVPIVLGGIYATLYPDHAAKFSGADGILTGPGESRILELAAEHTGQAAPPRFDPDNLDTYPYPAFDLQSKSGYIPLQTSRGCPFKCAYCASGFLNPRQLRRSPSAIVREIVHWHRRRGIHDFAFYDDALLMEAGQHAVPLLEGIVGTGLALRFHTPNALHIRNINAETAVLMFKAGFTTLRLGLETTAFDERDQLDWKVTESEFKRAVNCLKRAGFTADRIGAYLLVGLPDQDDTAIEASIQTVLASGITPIPAYYSPMPHTSLWKASLSASRYDLAADPVFTNNAIFPCRREGFSWSLITRMKNLVKSQNFS